MTSLTGQHATEKSGMEIDFDTRLAALTAEYEQKMRDLGQEKDQEREGLRSEL